jgi:hypothetical protein
VSVFVVVQELSDLLIRSPQQPPVSLQQDPQLDYFVKQGAGGIVAPRGDVTVGQRISALQQDYIPLRPSDILLCNPVLRQGFPVKVGSLERQGKLPVTCYFIATPCGSSPYSLPTT